MENCKLRERCDAAVENIKEALYEDKNCIAAYLLGSVSHDKVWEWSDIQIELICDDGYKGKRVYTLYEEGRCVYLYIHTLTEFKEMITKTDVDSHVWKAFSKGTKLFSKDMMLDELMEEAFILGEAEKEKELLLCFAGAVYYLNKAEKNFYVKENLENTIYFIPQIAENIACIEVLRNRLIPERELISQGKRQNPELFSKIYDPLFAGRVEKEAIEGILKECVRYLEGCTKEVYRPILVYLEKYGNLEHFQYEIRPHGFGINYEWLVRCGIVERYGISEKVPFIKRQTYRVGYRLITT